MLKLAESKRCTLFASVANKGFPEACCWRESNGGRWEEFGELRGTTWRASISARHGKNRADRTQTLYHIGNYCQVVTVSSFSRGGYGREDRACLRIVARWWNWRRGVEAKKKPRPPKPRTGHPDSPYQSPGPPVHVTLPKKEVPGAPALRWLRSQRG